MRLMAFIILPWSRQPAYIMVNLCCQWDTATPGKAVTCTLWRNNTPCHDMFLFINRSVWQSTQSLLIHKSAKSRTGPNKCRSTGYWISFNMKPGRLAENFSTPSSPNGTKWMQPLKSNNVAYTFTILYTHKCLDCTMHCSVTFTALTVLV